MSEQTLEGIPAAPGEAEGMARIVTNKSDIYNTEEGEVLVVKKTDEDYVIAINKAVAVIVEDEEGDGSAVKVGTLAGIPVVVGVAGALKALKTGYTVHVDGTHGKVTIRSINFHSRESG